MKKTICLLVLGLTAVAEERTATFIDRQIWKEKNSTSVFTMKDAVRWEERTGSNELIAFNMMQSDANFVYLYDYARSMWLALGNETAAWRVGNEGGFNVVHHGKWDNHFQFQLTVADGFVEEQFFILRAAVQLVADRFTTTSISKCTDMNAGRISVRDDYPIRKGVSAVDATPEERGQLLTTQLKLLETKKFPNVHILPYEPDQKGKGSLGYAYNQDQIELPMDAADSSDVAGEFKIHINEGLLGAYGMQYDQATFWASVIAHEMAHNMGHMHPVGDYSTDLEIVAFDNCIFKNSGFDRTIHGRYDMTCGRQ